MALLSPIGLLLLLALPLLAWLAIHRTKPRRMKAGTLFVWRRLAEKRPLARPRRRIDPLLLAILAAAALSALAVARPVSASSGRSGVIAVFLERTSPAESDDSLAATAERVTEEAPRAEFAYFIVDGCDALSPVTGLRGGSIETQLSQFERLSAGFDARILALCRPHSAAERLGRVVPRLEQRREGVVYRIGGRGTEIELRVSGGAAPAVTGAEQTGRVAGGDSAAWEYRATAEYVIVETGLGSSVQLERSPLLIATGSGWATPAHRALVAAAGLKTVGPGDDADLYLGGDGKPAIVVNAGKSAVLADSELSFDPTHSLFGELPMAAIDWRAEGRLIPPNAELRPLLAVLSGDEVIGSLVAVSGDGRRIVFAGDPFSSAPIAAASLLFDNTVGVLTGERPSARPLYRADPAVRLPSERQALAGPFPSSGSLKADSAKAISTTELSIWPALAAGLLALIAATVMLKRRHPAGSPQAT